MAILCHVVPRPTHVRVVLTVLEQLLYVAVGQIIYETVCDGHLFEQVSTRTGHYQLPIIRCTIVHRLGYTLLHFRRTVY